MTTLQRTLWFITLLLLQVLVFNHIHIMGYATPMPFIYLLLILHNETPRSTYVILGFALGLSIDIFSNTIGECAAAATLLGLLTPRLLASFSPADKDDDGFNPSAKSMKWSRFLSYALAATLLFNIVFFTIDTFSFNSISNLITHIGSSTLITLLIISAIERVRMSVKK